MILVTKRNGIYVTVEYQTFLRVLPTKRRRKPAGIDMERNYVTVTLCISWNMKFVYERCIYLDALLGLQQQRRQNRKGRSEKLHFKQLQQEEASLKVSQCCQKKRRRDIT